MTGAVAPSLLGCDGWSVWVQVPAGDGGMQLEWLLPQLAARLSGQPKHCDMCHVCVCERPWMP